MNNQPRASFQSPRFAQPATFMRLPYVEDPHGLDVAIVGVPYDGGTSYRPGARLAPREIRAQSSLIRPYNFFQKTSPFDVMNVADVGDVDAPPVSIERCYDAVEARIGVVADARATPMVIGGDHSITLPALRALVKRTGPVAIVHVDAHLDTSGPETWGDEFHHGTPIRHAIEEGLVEDGQLYQIGVRGPRGGADDDALVRRRGHTLITADQLAERGAQRVTAELRERIMTRPVYVTFDVDAVDPAFAPGTGTPVPGGLSAREALGLVRGLAGLAICGGDLVEYCPPLDHADITGHLSAHLVWELLAAIAASRR
jgi:agmatinase